MNDNELKQREEGARIIIERCKQFAQELGVDLKGVDWKEDIKQGRQAYTLIVHVGPGPDEIPLGQAEILAYSTRTGTEGTDEKLRSVIQKRPSGY
jgi:hypothetical protein